MRRGVASVLGVIALVCASAATVIGAPAHPADAATLRVTLTPVVSGLDEPVAFAMRAGDDAFYIAEQHSGLVRVVEGTTIDATPALDIGALVSQGGEEGLLGIAFSPDGSHLYADYTDLNGDIQVDEFAMLPDRTADMTTQRHVIHIPHPINTNHNGGQLVFGPDGYLYIGTGDGGGAGDVPGNAQNRMSLLGKILRIDPTPTDTAAYTIPPTNPFVGNPNTRPEIWQYGLRNPWRYTFDRATGREWIGDVGQNKWEEVDDVPAGVGGQNFGWNLREGKHRYNGPKPPGAVNPIYNYSHSTGACAIIGGYVYRGTAIPKLVGRYVFTDLCTGHLTALQPDGGFTHVVARNLRANVSGPTSFGQDSAGELYVLAGDTLSKLTP
jgi:glucose/arabinose dehydrogenase